MWSLGELTIEKEFFEAFAKFVTEMIRCGPDDLQYVFPLNNELIESKHLVYYLIMALVHLGRIDEAYGTLKSWLLNWENKKNPEDGSKNLIDGKWLHVPKDNPKENIFDVKQLENMIRTDGSRNGYLLPSLI